MIMLNQKSEFIINKINLKKFYLNKKYFILLQKSAKLNNLKFNIEILQLPH